MKIWNFLEEHIAAICLLLYLALIICLVGMLCRDNTTEILKEKKNFDFLNLNYEIEEIDKEYKVDLENSIGEFVVIDYKDISEDFLRHRADKKNAPIVIERVLGFVTNDAKDGEIINSDHNYISYRDIKDAQKGDFILTYLRYGNNNYSDDVVYRKDIILQR